MQIKIFSLGLGADDSAVEELNHFLRAHRIVDIKKELALMNGNHCWTFCITYLATARPQPVEVQRTAHSNKIDYREVLDAETFERFAAMRQLRKQLADRDAVPAYAVFTDAELASLARLPQLTPASMASVPGIGPRKVEKYGADFCGLQTNQTNSDSNETCGLFDESHSGTGQPV